MAEITDLKISAKKSEFLNPLDWHAYKKNLPGMLARIKKCQMGLNAKREKEIIK